MKDSLQKNQQQFESELKTSDKLAIGRTVLAQERTLMATVRTSVSLISFGFTIAKFFQDLKSMNVLNSGANIPSSRVGLWLVIIGTIYIILSSIQHVLVLKSLHFEGQKRRISFTFILAVLISLLGISLIVSFYSDIFSLGLNK
ncbi:MAG TPA: DUF202 domain-containing protein [Ignavibacteria bacterium]|nr:DUF202 domain-containing protein [Ignavibacteria bacterium]HMR39268.1 DUF202 domain-containing protein [Ignavibacteria bacterium]